MQGIGDHDVHIVNAMAGEHIQNNFQNCLAKIRSGHRRQRQADVVNGNRHFHARFELSEQRITAERMIQRIPDCRFTIRQPFSGGFG